MSLFLDMDGVLMDFDAVIAAHGIINDGYYYVPQSQWTPKQHLIHNSIIALLNKPEFWPSVGPMRDAHELWSWCAPMHPHILTAVLKEATDPAWVAECKRQSIVGNFDPRFPLADNFHVCLRHEKVAFAVDIDPLPYADQTPRANVLVDDNPKNCEEWTAAGGFAILHKSAAESIRQLREYYHV